jgi:hypothetical protein
MPRRLAAALLLLGLAGCTGSKLPDLHTVRGTVLKGKQPLAQALVALIPDDAESAAAFTVNGLTDEQGNFTVSTLEARTNKKRSGAPEGNYRVVVTLPMGADQSGGGSYNGAGKFTVAAGDNTIPTIDVLR